jgi:hypothetical protein
MRAAARKLMMARPVDPDGNIRLSHHGTGPPASPSPVARRLLNCLPQGTQPSRPRPPPGRLPDKQATPVTAGSRRSQQAGLASFVSSAGVRALRWVLRPAALVDATVCIIPPGEHLCRIMRLLGADDLLAAINAARPALVKTPRPR